GYLLNSDPVLALKYCGPHRGAHWLPPHSWDEMPSCECKSRSGADRGSVAGLPAFPAPAATSRARGGRSCAVWRSCEDSISAHRGTRPHRTTLRKPDLLPIRLAHPWRPGSAIPRHGFCLRTSRGANLLRENQELCGLQGGVVRCS